MLHRNSDPEPWYIIPVKPGAEESFRRWNLVIISILAALVLGFLLAAVVPQTPGNVTHKVPSKLEHVT